MHVRSTNSASTHEENRSHCVHQKMRQLSATKDEDDHSNLCFTPSFASFTFMYSTTECPLDLSFTQTVLHSPCQSQQQTVTHNAANLCQRILRDSSLHIRWVKYSATVCRCQHQTAAQMATTPTVTCAEG